MFKKNLFFLFLVYSLFCFLGHDSVRDGGSWFWVSLTFYFFFDFCPLSYFWFRLFLLWAMIWFEMVGECFCNFFYFPSVFFFRLRSNSKWWFTIPGEFKLSFVFYFRPHSYFQFFIFRLQFSSKRQVNT